MSREVEIVSNLPAIRERSSVLLAPVMDVQTAMKRLEEFQQFCAHYLQESKDGGTDGGDYGIIPGTKKKTLLKSGADKLCEVYGLYDSYVYETKIEDWDKGLFDYVLACVLRSRRDDSIVGSGVGSCSSYESKYRYRDQQRKCPKCEKETIIKGKEEYGGGWLCFAKKGGCGAKFKVGDKSIEDQTVGRIQNEDIADIKNTVLKMAKKRAKIDAVISVTRSSGMFTQDLEDLPPLPPVAPKIEVQTEYVDISPRRVVATANTRGEIDSGRDGVGTSVRPRPGAVLAEPSEKAPASERRSGAPITAEAGASTPPPPAPITYCGKSENTSFYTEIRKALPDTLKPLTEDWGRAFLKDKGYTKKTGDKSEGSLKNVEKALFAELICEAVETATKLRELTK